MTNKNRPYVGYMNPPEHTQFKKGKSGNPRGRPRKRDDMTTVLQRELNRKVTVKSLDCNMPIREALWRKLRELALKGDKQALALTRRILTEAGYDKPEPSSEVDRQKLFKEIGERFGHFPGRQENDDEG